MLMLMVKKGDELYACALAVSLLTDHYSLSSESILTNSLAGIARSRLRPERFR